MNIKIHLVGIKDKSVTGATLRDDVFQRSSLVNQEDGKIPVIKQYALTTNRDVGDSTVWYTTPLDPTANIFRTEGFKQKYFLAKSVKKVLGPNDTLIFTHTHRYGSGVNVNMLVDRYNEVPSDFEESPMGYFIIVEQWGPLCEGIEVEAMAGDPPVITQTTPRIGTAPGWMFMEIQNGYSYIKDANKLDADGGNTALGDVYVREFTSQVSSDSVNKLTNITPENIVADRTLATTGQMWIPVVSDKLRTTEFPKAGVGDL